MKNQFALILEWGRQLLLVFLCLFVICTRADAQDGSPKTSKSDENGKVVKPSPGAKASSIFGVVLDENDEPIVGAAVYDAAAIASGTVTSDDGSFRIIVSSSCKEITFECLGYKKAVVPIKETSVVRLVPDAQSITETVVTGIYTRKAESFTGAVQTVTSEELKRVSNANVFESLKNIDPSLLVIDNISSGSDPNSIASMQLRGASSFPSETTSLKSNFVNDPNMPLFILDGFETTAEKIQDLDMNRVESITILKDASAKAIYGSKAGNGVIVVETKQLRSNQTMVTYTGNLSLEMPDLTSYNLCNSLEKLEIERREGYYEKTSSSDSGALIDALTLYNERLKKALEGKDTYWLSKPLRTGIGHKHSLDVELGVRDLKALASFSYKNDQGAMKGSYRETVSGDVNLSYRKKKWLFRNIMSIAYMNSEDSPYGTFDEYARMNPYFSPYDSEGNVVRKISYDIGSVTNTVTNPLYNATIGTRYSSNYLEFTDNLYIEYHLLESLKLVGRVGIDTKRTGSESFKPGDHTDFVLYEDNALKGTFETSNGSSTTYSADVSAQLNHSFKGGHDVFATAQWNISQSNYSEVTHYAEGFPSSRMNDITYARQYATGMTPTGASGLNRNIGLLLTAGYSYNDRYMLDATAKGSASSVFGTNNKWGTFWSAGVAWNIHKEAFLKNAGQLKQLKLRFSAGSSGNQNYSTNVSLPVYKYYNDAFYNNFAGAVLSNMENPDLGWEQKMDYNLGLDLRVWNLSLVLDAYISDTENMVFSRSILPSTGFTSVSDNLGKVRNKGLEAGLSYRIFQKGPSWLSVFAKIAFNDNRILELSDVLRNYNKQQQENASSENSVSPVIQYYDGMPLHSIWVVPSLGIDPVTGKEIYLGRNGNMTDVWSASNLVNFGSSDPLYNGNFGLNGEFRGFGVSLVCTYYGGGYMYNSTLVSRVENTDYNSPYNVDRRIYSGRWSEPGQNALYRNGGSSPTKATSRFVQRNNVLSISSATVYYEFPYRLIKKAKMSRLRLTMYMNDLAKFSSIDIERGTSYPYARTFSFSLNVTF